MQTVAYLWKNGANTIIFHGYDEALLQFKHHGGTIDDLVPKTAVSDELDALNDKVEGLEEELAQAVEVAYAHGAVDWTYRNFPKIYAKLSARR